MKLKDTGLLPEKANIPKCCDDCYYMDCDRRKGTQECLYLKGEGYNQVLSELGEIDLNELIDEEKIKELIHKVSFEYADFKRQGRSQKGINPQLAQAIKSSNIWKEKSIT